jgi:septum formation topological specificity factor MinE
VSVLEEFFKRHKKSKTLQKELRLELRAHRSFGPQ